MARIPVKGAPQATYEINRVADTLVTGTQTVAAAGTAEALAATATPLINGVLVRALAANTDDVYVGMDDVDATLGFTLDAGEEVQLPISDLALVFVDAAVNGEGVSFVAY